MDEMNHLTYEECFAHTLFSNNPLNSLIVMDNASYHSWRNEPNLTKSWTKGKWMEWLSSKIVICPEKWLKSGLT